jgi:septum site-determining protein MinD
MPNIIAIHSFRGGTGKSNTSANVAAVLAAEGRRVAVIDGDLQSPGIHTLFKLQQAALDKTLNSYLWGACSIREAAHDVTASLGPGTAGRLFVVPSSIKPNDIARIIHEGYDVERLIDGMHTLIAELALDALLIDTHPGLNEETLVSIAVADVLAVVMRPDQQDYEGTSVTLSVARQLKVPHMTLVVNKLPQVFDEAAVKAHVEHTYNCGVAAVLPHSDELMILSSAELFALRYPEHAVTGLYRRIAAQLVA